MFFEIAKQKNEVFGSYHTLPNGLILNSDLGWKEYNIDSTHIVYKGYHTESFSQESLFKNMLMDPTPRYRGNFYMFISDNKQTVVTHNADRSSPIVLGSDSISNLFTVSTEKETNLWADRYVTVDKNFNTEQKFFNTYEQTFLNYDFNTALKLVDNIICESFENFLTHNTKPIKVFLSGGIDTLTVFTYLDKFTKKYEILDYEYNKFTHFYRNNIHSRLKKFWGYQQIHSWGDVPTVLMSGACGDEFFLRGPTTANMMLLHYSIDLQKELEKYPNCYHYEYFKRYKNFKIFNEQKTNNVLLNLCKDRLTIIKNILNMLVNDHQHWHIDETLFFTPFKNLKIPEILLGLPKKDFLDQVLDARFQKELIKNIDSSKLNFLSKFKNLEHLKYSVVQQNS